ncbi:MAG: glycosyltransferase family 39 protein, partial [Anaerolineae bacterium]|nr:glycosyltransferase family 39 protein [Anaerolineae bacterium]
LGLFALALAVRLPNLQLVPAIVDEGTEVLWGLDIALGRHWPLTSFSVYIGPVSAYLLAALFRLFGVHVVLPRLMMAVFGSLLVVTTYWLGRWVGGARVGLIAAGLTLVSPALVAEASHYAWSNCLTPFFTTLTLCVAYAAVTRRNVWLMGLTGLVGGLALQSHPTAAAPLAGLAVWYLGRRDVVKWLAWPGPYLALVGLVIGYAPMIEYNRRQPGQILSTAQDRPYAFAPTLDLLEVARRVVDYGLSVSRFVTDGLAAPTMATWIVQAVVAALLLVGLWAARRTESRMLPMVFLMSALVHAVVVKVNDARYLAMLIPVAAIGVGMGLVYLADRAGQPSRSTSPSLRLPQARLVFAALLPLALTAYGLLSLGRFYQQAISQELTNAPYFNLSETLAERGLCGPSLYVENVKADWFNPLSVHAVFGIRTLHYILLLEGCDHRWATTAEMVQALAAQPSPAWYITTEPVGATLAPGVRLTPEDKTTLPPRNDIRVDLTLYRVTRTP